MPRKKLDVGPIRERIEKLKQEEAAMMRAISERIATKVMDEHGITSEAEFKAWYDMVMKKVKWYDETAERNRKAKEQKAREADALRGTQPKQSVPVSTGSGANGQVNNAKPATPGANESHGTSVPAGNGTALRT